MGKRFNMAALVVTDNVSGIIDLLLNNPWLQSAILVACAAVYCRQRGIVQVFLPSIPARICRSILL